MKPISDIWYELYDLGINDGIDQFNEQQVKLYTYIDLMYSLEMGGLNSFLYNRIGDQEKFNKYINVLEVFGLKELATKLIKFSDVFVKTYDGREEVWEDFLGRTGIESEVNELDRKILHIVNEEKVQVWMTDNYEKLLKGLEE